jgi:hypothetical protein
MSTCGELLFSTNAAPSNREQLKRKYRRQRSVIAALPVSNRRIGKPLKERQNRTQRRINEPNADWKNGDELYRFKYKLLPEDGLTAEEVSWL